MTYSSGSPVPVAGGSKLADRKWRILNSWWILVPPLSFGMLSWLAFLVAAARIGRWTYWVFAGTYLGMLVLATYLQAIDKEGIGGTIAVLLLLVGCWLGATVHAAVLNRSYLRALASRTEWYAGSGAPSLSHPAPQPASSTPVLGISTDEYYAPAAATAPPPGPPTTPPPTAPPTGPPPTAPPTGPPPGAQPGRVDVNAATADTLGAIPGVSEELARRIVSIRDARGGYRDLDDLVVAANLQPHELVRLRDRLSFGDADGPEHPDPPEATGRILDI
jgi:hypothetical protein